MIDKNKYPRHLETMEEDGMDEDIQRLLAVGMTESEIEIYYGAEEKTSCGFWDRPGDSRELKSSEMPDKLRKETTSWRKKLVESGKITQKRFEELENE